MRLIDADSLKKRLIRQRDKICEQRKYGWEWTQDGLNAAIMQIGCEMVENPIEERKTGRWIVIDDQYELDTCKCSECGVVEYFNQGWKRFDYCPNCGAKMEVEHETD